MGRGADFGAREIFLFFSDREEAELRMGSNVLVTFTLKALVRQPTAHFVLRNGSVDSFPGAGETDAAVFLPRRSPRPVPIRFNLQIPYEEIQFHDHAPSR